MNIREIDKGVYISGQILPADLALVAQTGIRTIICNRPDGESQEQPDVTLIQQAAAPYGIKVHYIPVRSSGITDTNLQHMIEALASAERPLLAYCRSGSRSDKLYELAKHSVKTR